MKVGTMGVLMQTELVTQDSEYRSGTCMSVVIRMFYNNSCVFFYKL